MRRLVQLVAMMVLWGAFSSVQSTEVLDRIIAVVNGTPILQSDWDVALRCEAVMDGRAPESFTVAERQAVFGRLVDQELIREQMRGATMAPVTDEEVEARLKEVRSQLPAVTSNESWQQLLNRNGLTEADVRVRLRTQLELLRYLDDRMRPLARVDFRAVNRYYREQFLPELQKKGVAEVPLSEVSGKIREILIQQRIDEQITIWLQTLREGAEIRVPKPPEAANGIEVTESK